MKRTFFIFLVGITFTLASCAQNTSDPDSGNPVLTAAAMTVEAGIQASLAPPTAEPTQTPIPTMQPTPTMDLTQPATVLSPTLNLRAGPGTLFDIVATFNQGTVIYATGMTPGGDWLEISAPIGNGQIWTGWLAAAFLDTTEIKTSLPIIIWPENNSILGQVTDDQLNPVSSIRVAAVGETEQGEVRAEGISDLNGNFSIYLPPNLTGAFKLEIVAVNCTSNIADVQPDGSCEPDDHFPVVWRADTNVPQSEPVSFWYEHAAAYLEGKVVYQDGNGASQILIRATRISDGVSSEKVTPVGGEFSLPLGIGIWEVVAVRFLSDGTPLVGETRTYEVSEQGQIFEPLTIPFGEIIER